MAVIAADRAYNDWAYNEGVYGGVLPGGGAPAQPPRSVFTAPPPLSNARAPASAWRGGSKVNWQSRPKRWR